MDPSVSAMNDIMRNNNDILVAYTGYLSEALLASLGNVLREKLQCDLSDRLRTKRAFSLFCEQTQNIIRYSADRVTVGGDDAVELGRGMVVVGYSESMLYVICGNVIDGQQRDDVRARLDYLARLSEAELRSYYKQKIREPREAASKGGSVGLIEIARRSQRPIEYDFISDTNDRVFFCLKAYA